MLISLRNIFLKNWELKLFSFLLAVVIWFALSPEEKVSSEKILTIPLELHNVPPDLEVVEKPTSTVDVKIRAPQRLINDLSSANVHAVLDLRNARIEDREYPLNKNMISIPGGTEVKDIYPSQVNLRLEKIKEIMLEVEPNITGKLGDGLQLVRVEAIPSEVPVKGPESKIQNTYKVKTSPIDISSLTESTEIEADFILPNPDLKLATFQTKVIIRVVIQAEKIEEEKK